MDNDRCALFGRQAIELGTPDYGMNGTDAEGILTDASDTIANILHHLNEVGGEDYALGALDKASNHFTAELRGEL